MRVLILNSVCCWGKSNAPFEFLGEALAQRGVDVHHVVGGGECCSYYGTLADWNDEKCFGAQARATRNIETIGNPVRNMRDYETPEMHAEVEAWWQAQKDLPPGDRVYKGFRVRDLIRGSLARHLWKPVHPDPNHPENEENGSDADREAAHRMTRAAAMGIEIAHAALQNIRPDVVLLFNGYFYLEWIFSAVARDMGIRAVAHEIACFSDRMYFDANGMIGNRHILSSGQVNHKLDARALSEGERDQLREYLRQSYDGKINNIPQADREDLEGLRARLEIPADKKVIMLIGQVSYDTVVIYDSGVFPTALDYLRASIDAAAAIPDAHLVIRLHPHEVKVNNNWTYRQISEWDLPENVTIVHSQQANTYQLMELSDAGIAMTSQAGLEMVAFGKPVAVCGRAFYKGKGFTYDVTSAAQLREVLQAALDDGLTPDMHRRLETFLYHHIFEYLVPFDNPNDRFSDAAIDRILHVFDPIGAGGKPVESKPKLAPPRNLVPFDQILEDLAGWKGTGAEIALVHDDGDRMVLKVATGGGAWDGVLYGSEKPNTCDEKTLPCPAGAKCTLGVSIRGAEDAEGAAVLVQVVDNTGEKFGPARVELHGEWQTVSLPFRAKEDTTHLAVQMVKHNHAGSLSFFVDRLNVMAQESPDGSGAPQVLSRKTEDFPRLLLVDEVPFGNHTGYGVTITNLFRGWPKDRLAEIYRMADYEPDYSVCEQHLALFDSSRDPVGKQWPKKLQRWEYSTKLRMGYFDVHNMKVNTRRSLAWAKPFQPQAIFTSPVTYATAKLGMRLSGKMSVPYVCHIMDDWLAQWEAGVRPPNPGPREEAHQAKRNEVTKKLFEGASARQVISEMMATAYEKRYGHRFDVVHNAIDLRRWDLGPKDYSKTGSPFRILYTGAIWPSIQMPSIQHFAEAIAELGQAGHDVRLEIYTHENFEKQYTKALQHAPWVEFCGLAPYEEMPRLMYEADALLVPVTFDEDMFLFSQYSMPTKVPECMISGTPVILYGPRDATPVDYARRGGWGHVIDQPDKENLKQRVIELMKHPELRESAGVPARAQARAEHDLDVVRERFWNAIIEATYRRK
jgi:glycosyltransferase involved in cell wall biosynthesis